MSISKIFFLDFFNKKKITRTIIVLMLLPFLLSQMLTEMSFSNQYAGMIGITIALASTAYTLSSYALRNKLGLYITLPIKSWKLLWGLVYAIYADILFEKMSIFLIAVFFIFSDPFYVVLTAAFTSFICVLSMVALLLTMNAKKRAMILANAVALAGVILTTIVLSTNTVFWLAANICLSIIPIATIMTYDSAYLMINRQMGDRSLPGILSHNYFMLTMFVEKIYLINTLVIVAVITVFLIMFPDEPVILNLAWCMGAINTPAMTMLSGDKSISKQADMLPNTIKSIVNMYLRFLIGYFLFINLLILTAVSIKAGELSWVNIVIACSVVIMEVAITIFFEKNWRITDWQIQKELWRHPRKYVAPVIIFLFITGITMFLQ